MQYSDMIKEGTTINVDGEEMYIGHNEFNMPIMVNNKKWEIHKKLNYNFLFIDNRLVSILVFFLTAMVVTISIDMSFWMEFFIAVMVNAVLYIIPSIIGYQYIRDDIHYITNTQYHLVNKALHSTNHHVPKAIAEYINFTPGNLIKAEKVLEKIVSIYEMEMKQLGAPSAELDDLDKAMIALEIQEDLMKKNGNIM